MKAFSLYGYNGENISITIDEVFRYPDESSYEGGYDVKCSIKIKAGGYTATSFDFYTATGTIFRFEEDLKKCYESLKGIAKYEMWLEKNLSFNVTMTGKGHGIICGTFQELMCRDNILKFEIETDQSFLKDTIEDIEQLKNIINN